MTTVFTGGFVSAIARTGQVAIGAVALWFGLQKALQVVYLRRLLGGAEVTDANAILQANLLCCGTILLAMAVLFGFVTFLPWFWRAHRNVHGLGVEPVSARHWVVTGFLIPGVNLVQPYHVALEIWQQSDRVRLAGADPSERPRPTATVTGWWICLVSWAAGAVLVDSIGREVQTNTALLLIESVQAALSILGAGAALLGFLMIGRLDRLQQEADSAVRQEGSALVPG